LAVRIRLKRLGRKNSPFYRVVVAPQESPRNGRTIEDLGTYNPLVDPFHFSIKEDRVNYWISVGAQPSETLKRLLKIKKSPSVKQVETTEKKPKKVRKTQKAGA